MLMFYISCTTFGVVLNVFNLAANMGLYAARGVKPFQMNIIDPAAPADPAVVGAVIVAIISIWFFTKTYRRFSQEYSSKKDKDDPSSFAEYWTDADQREEGE